MFLLRYNRKETGRGVSPLVSAPQSFPSIESALSYAERMFPRYGHAASLISDDGSAYLRLFPVEELEALEIADIIGDAFRGKSPLPRA